MNKLEYTFFFYSYCLKGEFGDGLLVTENVKGRLNIVHFF